MRVQVQKARGHHMKAQISFLTAGFTSAFSTVQHPTLQINFLSIDYNTKV